MGLMETDGIIHEESLVIKLDCETKCECSKVLVVEDDSCNTIIARNLINILDLTSDHVRCI